MTQPQCGTYAGWNRHRKAGTPTCEPCKAAAAEYARKWRHRTGRSVGAYLTPMEIGHLSGKLGDFW